MPVFPAPSVSLAIRLCAPSPARMTVALHLPSLPIGAEPIEAIPSHTATVWPISLGSTVPLTVCVAWLVRRPRLVIATAAAAVSSV